MYNSCLLPIRYICCLYKRFYRIVNSSVYQPWYNVLKKIYKKLSVMYTAAAHGYCLFLCEWWFMVFNATFNNISVISWRSVLLAENTTDLPQVTDKLYHIMLYTAPWLGFELVRMMQSNKRNTDDTENGTYGTRTMHNGIQITDDIN